MLHWLSPTLCMVSANFLFYFFRPSLPSGAAIGFRLDSLLKLTDTRARNNKMTLMHYLCKVQKRLSLMKFPSLKISTAMCIKFCDILFLYLDSTCAVILWIFISRRIQVHFPINRMWHSLMCAWTLSEDTNLFLGGY